MWRHVNLMYITLNEEICGILPTCQFRLRPLNKLCGFPMNINFARTMVQTIFSPCFSSKAKSSPPTITMSGGISKCYIYIYTFIWGIYNRGMRDVCAEDCGSGSSDRCSLLASLCPFGWRFFGGPWIRSIVGLFFWRVSQLWVQIKIGKELSSYINQRLIPNSSVAWTLFILKPFHLLKQPKTTGGEWTFIHSWTLLSCT